MNKIKINFQYQYLGPEIGVVPYIHVGYINELAQEKDAVEILNERIKQISYYYGKTLEGKDFKVHNKKDIPTNVQYPFNRKNLDYNKVIEFQDDGIETLVKKVILDTIKTMGSGLEIYFCNYEEQKILTSSTTQANDLNDEKMKNALISNIHLNKEVEYECNYGIEDKVRIISMVMVKLDESFKTRKIGFSLEKDIPHNSIEFDIEGLSFELIKIKPNYEEIVYNSVLKHVMILNEKIAQKIEENNKKIIFIKSRKK